MTDEDIRKLLGGYATHTLSATEEKALFEAALHDEKLFAALADEQALREMLDDPGNRAAMLRALEPARSPWFRWMAPLGVAAGLVVIASVVYVFQRAPVQTPVQMAKVVVQPALQPEIQLDRAAPSAASAGSADAKARPAGELRRTEREPLRDRQLLERSEKKAESADAVSEPMMASRRTVAPAAPPPAATPSAPGPAPLSGASVSKESVEVQASAPVLSTGAIAGSGGARAAASNAFLNYAGKVQYTILKRGVDGQFKPVDARETLQPADAVRLNIEAEETGFLEISQKVPPKMLYKGIIQKQMPVIVPATGNLDLSNQGSLQIQFSQPGLASGDKNSFLPAQTIMPRAVSKRKAASESDSQKTDSRQNAAKDQAGQAANQAQAPGTITLDVNLNVATPSQQQKK